MSKPSSQDSPAAPGRAIPSWFDLSGRVVVITGGAGLLGREHAIAILEAGGTAVLMDVDTERADAACIEFGKRFPAERIVAITADVTSPHDVRRTREEIGRRFGRVDALINNAARNPTVTASGLPQGGRFETMSLEEWNADLAVSLTGAFNCSQVFGTWMADRGTGSIVNISSDLGLVGPDQRLYRRPGLSEESQPVKPVTYSVTKTGIIGLTRYLATYWAGRGVRANALALGGVRADQPQEFLDRVQKLIPLGRMAHPYEYHGIIVFLCSDASAYMTGATLVADGGRTVW
jgi:NAD(P)-dependent dehydrogenase (short-subunit alcohol dehydrogenase family)